MKALVNRRSIIIASIAFLMALIALVSVNVFNSAGPVTGFANTITRPVRALVSTVAETFGTIYASIYRYTELESRNDELLQMIAQYEANFREATALAEENQMLRDLLEFRRLHGGYAHEMATVIDWGSDNWTSTFVINMGSMNSDIARGMPIATEYGVLIGQVSDVGAVTSTIITVLDTTFSASAFIGGHGHEDADGTATVRGDFSYMRSGLLTLDFIDDDIVVNPRAIVTTSGFGGVFPTGLIIGEVENVYNHTSGIGRFATIRPLRDIDTSINRVFVIMEFENPD